MFPFAFLLLFFAPDCREAYLDKALTIHGADATFAADMYYIVFKCNVEGRNDEVMVSSHKIYYVLRASQRVKDSADYLRFMKGKLLSNDTISFTVGEMRRMNAATVRDRYYAEILAIAEKSPDSLLNRFFQISQNYNYARETDNLPMDKFGSIMKVLFQKNYLIYLVEGRFNIDQLNFCSLHSK